MGLWPRVVPDGQSGPLTTVTGGKQNAPNLVGQDALLASQNDSRGGTRTLDPGIMRDGTPSEVEVPPSIECATVRHGAPSRAPVLSATSSAKGPRCPCGETRVEMFGKKTNRGRVGYQHRCKPCMVEAHREWRSKPEGRAKMRAGVTASRRRYPEKERARRLLRNAVNRGDLVLGPCYAAGPDCSGGMEAHHADYSKPLAVTFTCRAHHRPLDLARRSA